MLKSREPRNLGCARNDGCVGNDAFILVLTGDPKSATIWKSCVKQRQGILCKTLEIRNMK